MFGRSLIALSFVLCLPVAADVLDIVSSNAAGTADTSGINFFGAASADGRVVAFCSKATTLVPTDTGDGEDIFIKDRQTGAVERIGLEPAGTYAFCRVVGVSGDGRYVSFMTDRSGFVAGDTDGSALSFYLYDRDTDAFTLLSADAGGAPVPVCTTPLPLMSRDATRFAFCTGTNLDPANEPFDVNVPTTFWLRDLSLGTTHGIHINRNPGAVSGSVLAFEATMSADGKFIAFESNAPILPGMSGIVGYDVYRIDLDADTIAHVSRDALGSRGNGDSNMPAINADGRYVLFYSMATNLDAAATTGAYCLYRRDMQAGTTAIVGYDNLGAIITTGAGHQFLTKHKLSDDGRYISGFDHRAVWGYASWAPTSTVFQSSVIDTVRRHATAWSVHPDGRAAGVRPEGAFAANGSIFVSSGNTAGDSGLLAPNSVPSWMSAETVAAIGRPQDADLVASYVGFVPVPGSPHLADITFRVRNDGPGRASRFVVQARNQQGQPPSLKILTPTGLPSAFDAGCDTIPGSGELIGNLMARNTCVLPTLAVGASQDLTYRVQVDYGVTLSPSNVYSIRIYPNEFDGTMSNNTVNATAPSTGGGGAAAGGGGSGDPLTLFVLAVAAGLSRRRLRR